MTRVAILGLKFGELAMRGASAELALHTGCFKWLELAFTDADLQRVIAAWGDMLDAIRRAVLALVGSLE
jgi:hypothetical protein